MLLRTSFKGKLDRFDGLEEKNHRRMATPREQGGRHDRGRQQMFGTHGAQGQEIGRRRHALHLGRFASFRNYQFGSNAYSRRRVPASIARRVDDQQAIGWKVLSTAYIGDFHASKDDGFRTCSTPAGRHTLPKWRHISKDKALWVGEECRTVFGPLGRCALCSQRPGFM